MGRSALPARRVTAGLLALFIILAAAAPSIGAGAPPDGPRERTDTMNDVSLQFIEYRGDPKELAAKVDRYLAGARQEVLPDDPAALVVPHAGYIYSAPVAAYAYGAVKGKSYDTVVVVGPSHRLPFRGISVWEGDDFETPLGRIPIDKALTREILAADREIAVRDEAHRQEHSVEVQLPFLQRVLPKFSLVMAVVGGWSPSASEAFVATLLKNMKKKKILLVASSDLSHYHDYATARKMDAEAVELVRRMDFRGLLDANREGKCELCGLMPVVLAMDLAKRAGYGRVELLHAASSGDTAGPKDQVVGYAAMAFLPSKGASAADKPRKEPAAPAPVDEGDLGSAEKRRLLEIARQTITAYVRDRKVPEIKEDNPKLLEKSGAFVTIKRRGDLRGCIGNFVSQKPLFRTIMDMAVAASTQDPRFPPMTPAETEDMELEISVLTPMRRISDPKEIEVGKHGIYLVKGPYGGTLLPQVATEYGWDRMTFLEQCCRKAGLPTDAWKEGAEIYVYGAQVFGEKE